MKRSKDFRTVRSIVSPLTSPDGKGHPPIGAFKIPLQRVLKKSPASPGAEDEAVMAVQKSARYGHAGS